MRTERTEQRLVGVAFDLALLALLVLITTDAITSVLPDELAVHVGRNSEGVCLALVVVVWLQTGLRWSVSATALASVTCLAIAGGIAASDWTNRVRTLNEAFLGAAVILPYLAIRRPLPRRVPLVIAGTAVAVAVTLGWTALVRNLAETVAMVAVGSITIDVMEGGLTDQSARAPGRTRATWYAVIAAFPVVVQTLDDRITEGVAGRVIVFASRTTEAFVFVLLLGLYTLLPIAWSQRRTVADGTPAATSTAR